MSKHTQGPWIVKSTIIGSQSSIKLIGRKDRDLSDQEMVCMVPQTNEEQVANTLLIQFAPDLLEALQAFPGFTDDATIGDAWIKKMRTAIAKATGNCLSQE
mgnify:FL=1